MSCLLTYLLTYETRLVSDIAVFVVERDVNLQLTKDRIPLRYPAREPAHELVRELDSVMEFGL